MTRPHHPLALWWKGASRQKRPFWRYRCPVRVPAPHGTGWGPMMRFVLLSRLQAIVRPNSVAISIGRNVVQFIKHMNDKITTGSVKTFLYKCFLWTKHTFGGYETPHKGHAPTTSRQRWTCAIDAQVPPPEANCWRTECGPLGTFRSIAL